MRRLGIWKRLRAAPVSRRLLLGSRILSGTVIALLLLAGIYAAAIAFFGVRIEGSVIGFVAVALAFSLLTATFGLLIAAIGRTPEATRGIAIVATLLLVMLGGAWVPTFVFPEWLQTATLVVPTRWAIDGLDGDDLARPPARRCARAGRRAARVQRGVRVDRGSALRLGGVRRPPRQPAL